MDLYRSHHTFPLWRKILSGAVFALALLTTPIAVRARQQSFQAISVVLMW